MSSHKWMHLILPMIFWWKVEDKDKKRSSSTSGGTEGSVACNSVLSMEPEQYSTDWCTVGLRDI